MDLFDDLPDPVNKEAPLKTLAPVVPRKTEKRPHPTDKTPTPEKVVKGDRIKLQGCCVERRGEREEMQDAHKLIDTFYPHNPLHCNLSFYGVFDGHGGKRASNYLANKMHHAIAAKFPKNPESLDREMKKCMIDSFKVVDDAYLNEARRQRPSWKDGSTAVVVVCVDGVLYIANLGDSKAILCREDAETGKMVAVALTTDHHPTNYEERMRIQKAGGFVRDGRVMGVLEVSRSIGDGALKKHGVTSLPDVKRYSLSPRDKFLVIACDGLWKTFDNQKAVNFVNTILNDKQIQGTEYKTAAYVRLETACNRVANEAVRRLSADNVTVMLVSVTHSPSSILHHNNNNKNNSNNNNNNNKDGYIKDDLNSNKAKGDMHDDDGGGGGDIYGEDKIDNRNNNDDGDGGDDNNDGGDNNNDSVGESGDGVGESGDIDVNKSITNNER